MRSRPHPLRLAAPACALALATLAGAPALVSDEGSPAPSASASLEPAPLGLARLELLSEAAAVAPGRPLTVGLLIEPARDHHTYWRSPGIVGVATTVEWILPEGFAAGELLWPPPESVSMAGILAHGYGGAAFLLAEITVPDEVGSDEIEIRARCGWMACAASCHPGHAELSLRLPLFRGDGDPPKDPASAALFEEARRALPRPAPEEWRFRPRTLGEDWIALDISVPGRLETDFAGLRFYSYDLQVDSSQAQRIGEWRGEDGEETRDAAFRLELPRSPYGPEDPDALAGLLHLPGGWPGLDSAWIELRAPWGE